jgi:tetratricopeptide (TPR) repeat protein
MEKEDLLDVLRMLVEDNPLLSGKIALVLNERQHVAELHSDRVRQMGLYSSLKFYSEAIPRVLSECEALFSEVEGCDDDWEDGYYDEDEVTEWDFSAGLERLHRYGRELLDMVTQQHYISGTVGLLVGLLGLEDWKDEYLAEYGDQELEEGCDEFHSYLCEALGRVKGYRRADAAAQDFLFELMDWMVLQCNEPGGLADWAWLLSDCVVDLQGLRHLETSIRRLDQDFLQSNRLEDERKRRPLVYWWVDLCLQYDREQEAIEAAGVLRDTGDDSVERLFVRYYERNERWQEAVVVLGELIKGKAGPADYRWMADLCKQAGDLTREKEWLQKWFLSFPDFELFKRNVELLTEREEREKTIEFWLAALKKKEYFELIIQIYLFLNDPESAWKEYTRHGQHVFENNPILLKLFKEMKRRDPSKLIPQYKSLIMHNIGRRDRSSYAIAARWLKDLQEVCFLAGEEEKWTEFYHGIMSEYKRFRALMEEIRRVIK